MSINKHDFTRQEENRLFAIAKRCMAWAEFTDYTDDQLWDLVMQDLCNIKGSTTL